jgi:hypothetical protein
VLLALLYVILPRSAGSRWGWIAKCDGFYYTWGKMRFAEGEEKYMDLSTALLTIKP